MSHDPSSPQKLVTMANQIGKFFAPRQHDKAVAGIANHLSKFWALSMREKMLRHLDRGGEGLDPLVKEAVQHLRVKHASTFEYSGDA